MLQDKIFITEKNINEYIEYLKNEERAGATIEKYARIIFNFAIFLNGAEITKEAAIKWENTLLETHAATSVNAMLAAVNGFFEFLNIPIKMKPLKIQRNPFLSEEQELTPKEYRRLLEAANTLGNDRIYHVMQTICSTGIRVSELRFITVEAVRTEYAEVRNKGKIRMIFIPRELKQLLLKYAKKHGITSGCIFITKNGRPLDRSNIWSDMKKLCEAAGVDKSKVFPHALRKLFARIFYSKSNDIMKLADSLGHSDVKTTRIYIMDTGREHRRIIDSLGLVIPMYGT